MTPNKVVEVKAKTKIKRPSDSVELKHSIMKLIDIFYSNIDFDNWKIKYFKQKNGKVALKYTGKKEDKDGLKFISKQLGLTVEDFKVTIWEDEYEYAYQFVF